MIKLIGKIKGILLQDQTDRTKELSIEIDPSSTAETRTTLSSAQTADRSVVLPDADDTLVGKATTDVLTNKTIDGDDNTIQNIDLPSFKTQLADAGKFIVRNGSGDVVSDNTVPTGTVLGDTDSQIVTNKSIDADGNTITNIDDGNVKVGAAIDAAKIGAGDVSNTEFQTLDGVTSSIQTQIDSKQSLSEKGVANGYASLDGSGLVPVAQLPSYVDDVLEFAGFASFPATGETGKIYVTLDTNLQYRWSGSVYVQISTGVTNIGDLVDVNTTGVTEGQALVWNDTNSRFEPFNVSALVQENIALVGTGNISWTVNDPGTNIVTLSEAVFVSIPGIPNTRHAIQDQGYAINDNEIGYVVIDREATSDAFVPVIVEPLTSFVPDNNKIIVFRSYSSQLFFGMHDPTRLEDGDTIAVQKGGVSTPFVSEYFEETDNGLNVQSSVIIDQWYQPASTWSITLDPGTYNLGIKSNFQGNMTSGTGFFNFAFGTSSTPGVDLFDIRAGNLLDSVGTLQTVDYTYENVVVTATTTFYPNVRVQAFTGGAVPSSLFLRNNLINGGVGKLWARKVSE